MFDSFKKIWEKILFIFFFLLLLNPSLADRGMISFLPVRIEETGQNAIVAWNGKEELIILSTNVRSISSTPVLEVLPLPSNPTEIKAGNSESFKILISIIEERLRRKREFKPSPFFFDIVPTKAPRAPAIEITFHKEIGAHDLTVVKVNRVEDFIGWVKNFTLTKGFEMKKISPKFKSTIENYVKRGIKYFVFDVIQASPEERSIEPIIYRFSSNYLFYPFLITATSEAGESFSTVNIFIIVKGKVNSTTISAVGLVPESISFRYGYREVPQITLLNEEVKAISPELAELFETDPYLVSSSFFGPLKFLTSDLVISAEDIYFPTFFEILIERFYENSIILNSLPLLLIPDLFSLIQLGLTIVGIGVVSLYLYKILRFITKPILVKFRFFRVVNLGIVILLITSLIFSSELLIGVLGLFFLPIIGFIYLLYFISKLLREL